MLLKMFSIISSLQEFIRNSCFLLLKFQLAQWMRSYVSIIKWEARRRGYWHLNADFISKIFCLMLEYYILQISRAQRVLGVVWILSRTVSFIILLLFCSILFHHFIVAVYTFHFAMPPLSFRTKGWSSSVWFSWRCAWQSSSLRDWFGE